MFEAPAVRPRLKAPLMAFEKVILLPAGLEPLFVESSATAAVKKTGPVIVMTAAFVVTFPPRLIAVEPV